MKPKQFMQVINALKTIGEGTSYALAKASAIPRRTLEGYLKDLETMGLVGQRCDWCVNREYYKRVWYTSDIGDAFDLVFRAYSVYLTDKRETKDCNYTIEIVIRQTDDRDNGHIPF